MNDVPTRSLDEWLRDADQDLAHAIAADTDIENALGLAKVMAVARPAALAVSANRSLARSVIEAYESVDRTPQETPPNNSAVEAEAAQVPDTRAPGDSWDLVHAAQQGDTDAFAQLYDRYVDVVHRYVLFRVGDRALADDVTSETFLRALRRIASVSYQGRDVGAWFVTIARNLLLDHVKSSRFRLEIAGAEVDSQKVEPDSEQEAMSRVTTAALLECVEQLGDDQRECIVLRFVQGLSVAETAEIMNRNERAVKALQHRAVRRLVQLLPAELR